jgi:tetratricopeptide (TPR) repeat protein
MGWLRSLLGDKKGPDAVLEPDALRQLLFDAAGEPNRAAFARLCATHEEAILVNFPRWKRVPEAFRGTKEMAWYGGGMIALARHFAEKRGHPELLNSLAPPPEANPLSQWTTALRQVDEWMKEGRHAEGVALMRDTLASVDGLSGPGVDAYLPITHGRLGECLFNSGSPDEAVAPMERALEGCRSQNDEAGVVSYLGNLYEIHRYRGDAVAAADSLETLALTLERLGDSRAAAGYRRQLSIVKEGEPLCRVVVEREGERFELSNLPRVAADSRFVFVRNRIALRPSTLAVSAGEDAGMARDFEGALAHFRRAALADAYDPWPRYHEGGTLLYLRRYSEAEAALEATELLAPGFYHCRSDRWLAEQLAKGAVGHETFLLVRRLTDGAPPASVTVDLARAGLAKADVAPLWLELGKALGTLGRREEAEEAYRRGLDRAAEADVRTRLLVELGAIVRDAAEKAEVLHEAIELRGNLVASAMAMTLLSPSSLAS